MIEMKNLSGETKDSENEIKEIDSGISAIKQEFVKIFWFCFILTIIYFYPPSSLMFFSYVGLLLGPSIFQIIKKYYALRKANIELKTWQNIMSDAERLEKQ